MMKILCDKNNISRIVVRNIRKYTEGCRDTKPEYDCPHIKKLTSAEKRELKRKAFVHPFLRKECKHNADLWRNIFFFICVPCIIVAAINVKYFQKKEKRLPYIDYSHLRIRKKKYPWKDGNKTLFHNPKVNALPGGYETEFEDEDDD